jgi:hypothetical protein
MATTYEKIATTTLGSANNTVTFASIASTWTDIRLIYKGTNSANGSAYLRVGNGSVDSGNNYSFTYLYSNGSAVSSGRSSSTNSIFLADINTGGSMVDVNIFSYAGSTFKTILGNGSDAAIDSNQSVGLWRNTAAINYISIFSTGGNFTIGSMFTLYGIKAA